MKEYTYTDGGRLFVRITKTTAETLGTVQEYDYSYIGQ